MGLFKKLWGGAATVKQHDSIAAHLSEIVEGGNRFALDLYRQVRTGEGVNTLQLRSLIRLRG